MDLEGASALASRALAKDFKGQTVSAQKRGKMCVAIA